MFYFRLLARSKASLNHVVLAMIYMNRVYGSITCILRELPTKLIFTACLVLAFNYQEDCTYTITSWANMSGFSPKKARHAIFRVLNALNHSIEVEPSLFKKYLASVTYIATPMQTVFFKEYWTPPGSPGFSPQSPPIYLPVSHPPGIPLQHEIISYFTLPHVFTIPK
ncbi:hypothetical protein DSO57_1021323 [Entomophthora muscae]|uniref:Uncharacterized protein n=1 Tax=Entomophthora muscae TaxID=34485 RepID=A0ACC2T3W7_9FUNG|nr:hypothetical protein DSO57_1021323 [Entomophthora muscae]